MRTTTLPFLLALLAAPLSAQQPAEWSTSLKVGAALADGLGDAVVDARGNSYLTMTAGPSSNTDILTVARGPDGSTLWSRRFNGPNNWHDQARGVAIDSARSIVWVTGNTPGARRVANALLLGYDARSGTLRYTHLQPSTFSEHGGSVVTDAAGNVYVAGGTVGDGADVLILKFDSRGKLLWRRTWDGAARGPFSQDIQREISVDPQGNPVVLIHGVSAFLQPDYVVLELSPAGSVRWTRSWGVRGGDHPRDMEIDAAGDVFVTGIGINGVNQFSTIRLRGTDGALLWQAYDTQAFHNSSIALALDGAGGVYILGSIDPDGDRSNANDDIYLVKRDASRGALAWTYRFGVPCRGCLDRATDVAVDRRGNVYLGAVSSSPPYSRRVLTFVLDAKTGAERERRPLLRTLRANVGTGHLRFDSRFDLYNAGQSRDPTTGAVSVSIFKYTSPASYRFDVSDLLGNSFASLDVRNATPNTLQLLTVSAAGTGRTPIPPLRVTLGLKSPILLAVGGSDRTGRYSLRVPIPPVQGSTNIWLQALEPGATTPVIARVLR